MSIKGIIKYAFFFLIIFPSAAHASCNFKTSKYVNQINLPSSIKEINIETPNSRGYYKNFLKILTSMTDNIPPQLRKKFKANVEVIYQFGKCNYKGKVWQNGDWRDHIEYKNGRAYRSLNVKLDDGNIMNSTKFKFLLPETRGGLNEILGSLIAKKIGFISPETFEVFVNVNKVGSLMIFQEDSQKELLERNQRREGPIFEGDEELLWSIGDKALFELEDISLSRVINKNWFLKGKTSQIITLNSFFKLQEAYLNYSNGDYSQGKNNNQFFVFIDKENSNILSDYFFLMISMGGEHALRPHNRKFYFNSFLNLFEPIYYDGNLKLSTSRYEVEYLNKGNFQRDYKFPYIHTINSESFKLELLEDFKNRVANFDDDVARFFNASLTILRNKVAYYQKYISSSQSPKIINESYLKKKQAFLERLYKHKLNYKVINK